MQMAVARANAALWLLLAGLALLAAEAGCLRGSALVAELKAKAKAALLNPSPIPVDVAVEGASEDGAELESGGNGTQPLNVTRAPLLTGDPQKDYVYDPNLPRELNGYNLSSYPFYNGVPPNIKFDCDNLHDGFYASVPHKCQVYHHCLFGTRYDFLCANYTAFDQRTFICHFVSEVDCDNSPKFYQRNEALYKTASTSPPVTTTSAPPPTQPTPSAAVPPTTAGRRPDRPHRRRPPGRRRRPVYEYYDDDQYDEDEYYDEEPPPNTRRKATRKHRPQGRHREEEDDYYEERREISQGEHQEQEQTSEAAATVKMGGPAAGTVYDRPRVPPKIRRPVPIHERDKYDYTRKTADGDPAPTPNREPKKPVTQRKPADEDEDEYYDEEYEEEYVKPAPKRLKSGSDSRRPNGRYRPRQTSRRRPDRYDDDYEEDSFVRSRKRTRLEDTRPSSNGRGGASGGHRGRFRDEPDPVPADRPGFISNGRFSTGSRKAVEGDRGQQPPRKKPSREVYDDEEEDEEYYDDDEEEEESDGVRRSQKPLTGPGGGGVGGSASLKRKAQQPAEQRTPSRHPLAEEDRCRRDCDRGRLDEQDDSRPVKRKGVERDNQSQENDNQKHDSDRERLFSSRFRDSQNESSKLKENSPDAQFQGRPSSGLRATTQSPEPIQRQVYVPRPKPSSGEHVTPQTKPPSLSQDTRTVNFSGESSSDGNVKLPHFRSKGRPSASHPLSYTNTKSMLAVRQQQETAEQLEPLEKDTKSTIREEPAYPSDGKSYAMPRPFNGAGRRQIKTTTEPVSIDESTASPTGLSDRQLESITVEGKRAWKPVNTDVSYKKVPFDPLQVETYEHDQPKTTYTQVDSGRESIPAEDAKSDYIPYDLNDRKEIPSVEENVRLTKPSIPEKFQFSSPNIGGVYRRVKVNAAATPTPQTDEPTPSYEGAQASRPVNNNKRPYTLVRPFSPLSDRPIAVEDTTKNAISSSSVPLRRLVKQRTEESERTTPADLRQGSIAYFSSKRGKIRPDENLRGQDRYTKRLSLNGESAFSKQMPKIDITAPGPSAPDSDIPEIATVKSDYKNDYNAASQGFTLDIPEEEYDVTLNDALQPSTLHPTRSLIDYRRAGPKARDRPYSVRDPDYVNGGRAASVVAYRTVPASQQYIGVAPEAQRQDTQTNRESSANRNQEEYEAIVLTASGGDQPWLGRQDQPSQPTEWFW